MKEIIISNGEIAFVSDEDFDYLNQWQWHKSDKYVERGEKGIAIRMHREVAIRMGIDTSQNIDHKDGNILNNQRENLRSATKSQNQANSKIRKDNSSGYKGVSFYRNYRKWVAQIRVKGRNMILGYFSTPEEAALTYDKAARKFFGEFAKCNFEEKVDEASPMA